MKQRGFWIERQGYNNRDHNKNDCYHPANTATILYILPNVVTFGYYQEENGFQPNTFIAWESKAINLQLSASCKSYCLCQLFEIAVITFVLDRPEHCLNYLY